MPSPFPGMDPFLEDPMYWPDVHHRLITAIGDELAGLITLQRRGRDKLQVWYASLRDPLPTVAVPLRPPYEDVPLEQQRILNETYDRARYADSVEYTDSPPLPALKTPDILWVRRQLAEWRAQRGTRA
jgi:hypothetical protein